MIPKINILKKWKKNAKYYPFTYVYHKWRYDIWLLKYKVQQLNFIVILSHFLPFDPWKLRKSKFWKIEKNTWKFYHFAYYHFTHVYHNWQSYDVWSWDNESNRYNFLSLWVTFCHLTALTICKIRILKKWKKKPWRYNHFTDVYHKWQSYDVWFSRYGVQQTESHPLDNPIWFWKNEKNPRDIIILHKYTKKHDHKLLCSWDKAHDRCNFFLLLLFFIWGYFLKKWKKHLKITSFYTCAPKIIITWCTVFEIWYARNGHRRMEKKTWRGGCPI